MRSAARTRQSCTAVLDFITCIAATMRAAAAAPAALERGTGGTDGNGTADGGAVADCDVCTQAQQCCDVVASGGPVCSFSAASCSSMVGDARPAYVNACLVFLVTARGARANPPAECR